MPAITAAFTADTIEDAVSDKRAARRRERDAQRAVREAGFRGAAEDRAEAARRRSDISPGPSLLTSEATPATGAEPVKLTGAAGVGNKNKIGGQRSLLGVI